jgi:hypothetical protein
MAGAGKKTFTAGEVLTASDVNTYLMEQSVMVFGGTAARASAIPTPSTGMTSYIGTTGTATIPQIESYTGSAWQTPYGTTLISKVDFTTQSSVAIDNVFTTAYDNYIMHLTYVGTTNAGLRAVYRTSVPADVATGYYWGSVYTGLSAGPARAGGANVAYLELGTTSSGSGGTMHVSNIGDIALAKSTKHQLNNFSQYGSDIETNAGGAVNVNATAYAGIRIHTSSGTITGTVRIYGVRTI